MKGISYTVLQITTLHVLYALQMAGKVGFNALLTEASEVRKK